MRFPLEIIAAVRAVIPETSALFVRLSVIDGVESGWTLEESVVFARELKARGVDVIDCSSGGIGGAATMNRMARSPGFQVPLASAIRREADMPTVAVGLILTPAQADAVIVDGSADIVAIGREFLAHPSWANMALTELDGTYAHWPANAGWWLDKRAAIIRGYKQDRARSDTASG